MYYFINVHFIIQNLNEKFYIFLFRLPPLLPRPNRYSTDTNDKPRHYKTEDTTLSFKWDYF